MFGIAQWLASIGMSEYAQRFAENRVDLSVLRDLTDQDLKDLGVWLGDRRKMLRAIAELDAATSSQSEIGRLAPAFNSMLAELAAVHEREIADQTRSAERAMDLLVSVTGIAGAAASIPILESACLKQICKLRHWQLGQVWHPDLQRNVLICSPESVYAESDFTEFRKLSLEIPMPKGRGLPGRVWESISAHWLTNVADDSNFPRLRMANEMGLKAAFAFPVTLDREVLAVFEFFSRKTRAPDRPFLDAVEKLGHFLGDVRERKRAEAALRASEERWRSVFETSTFGISIIGHDLHYLATNTTFQTMLGYTGEELRQRTPMDISIDEYREVSRTLLMELQQGKRQHYDIVKQYRHKDGTVIWGHSYVSVVPDGESKPRILVGSTIDITDSKRAQDALRVTQSELARVTRLTTMGQLAASIAHEINQPLAAIVASANAGSRWLGNTTPDLDEARATFKRIARDAHRASQVIGSVRAMFKKDSQDKALLNVNGLIREVLTVVNGEVQGHRVSVCTDLTDRLPHVLADRVQLQQVLMNLITNAIDAMSVVTNHAQVLRIKSEIDKSHGVLISVEDSGTGIDAKNIDRIFDPFFTTKSHGMGMGLSICRSIIEAHDGRLWVSPGIHHGSVFHVSLPRVEASSK